MMEELQIVRRIGAEPLHHKCNDALSADVTFFELLDGSNAGDFAIIGEPLSEEETAELHSGARAMEGGGGVGEHESAVVFRDLGKAACRIFPVTQAELRAITPLSPATRAPRPAGPL